MSLMDQEWSLPPGFSMKSSWVTINGSRKSCTVIVKHESGDAFTVTACRNSVDELPAAVGQYLNAIAEVIHARKA